MKIITVVGARPQFIKAALLSRALREAGHQELLVHTGQHYDYEMSDVFFEELDIPRPEKNLEVGSGAHGWQTGHILERLETVMQEEKPERVILYGDTNSTLAGALAAVKLHIPVAHVEAGLRSFNRRMPEEINRVVADHLADLLLCPSATAVTNLANEGITKGVYEVGDVMADVLAYALKRIEALPERLEEWDLKPKGYLLATVHRAENTDEPLRLKSIMQAFNQFEEPVIFPAHPRTRKAIQQLGLELAPNVRVPPPQSYLDMVRLEKSARMILTDSGGVQKEAYWLSVPCITLRDETEWVETIETGWNRLVSPGKQGIVEAVQSFVQPDEHPLLYGDGRAVERCVDIIQSHASKQ